MRASSSSRRESEDRGARSSRSGDAHLALLELALVRRAVLEAEDLRRRPVARRRRGGVAARGRRPPEGRGEDPELSARARDADPERRVARALALVDLPLALVVRRPRDDACGLVSLRARPALPRRSAAAFWSRRPRGRGDAAIPSLVAAPPRPGDADIPRGRVAAPPRPWGRGYSELGRGRSTWQPRRRCSLMTRAAAASRAAAAAGARRGRGSATRLAAIRATPKFPQKEALPARRSRRSRRSCRGGTRPRTSRRLRTCT